MNNTNTNSLDAVPIVMRHFKTNKRKHIFQIHLKSILLIMYTESCNEFELSVKVLENNINHQYCRPELYTKGTANSLT